MNTPTIRPGTVLALGERNPISHWPKISYVLYTVGRVTATQAIAVGPSGEIRVRLKDLGIVGEPYARVAIVNEEMQAKHDAEVAEYQRYRAANALVDDLIGRPAHQLKLTTTQLEALADAWVKIKAMKPTTP